MQLPVFEPSIPNNTIKIESTGMFHMQGPKPTFFWE